MQQSDLVCLKEMAAHFRVSDRAIRTWNKIAGVRPKIQAVRAGRWTAQQVELIGNRVSACFTRRKKGARDKRTRPGSPDGRLATRVLTR